MADPHWVDAAACRGVDPELFFANRPAGIADALDVCGRCPVVDDCLADAVESDDRWSICGGQTPERRRRTPEQPRRTA